MFERELEELKNKISEMGECVHGCYDTLYGAVKEDNHEALETLLESRRQMTDMQRNIEVGCLALMTKQQPVVARDMRLVSSVLKAVTDIERVGGHVSDMAELFLRQGKLFTEDGCGGLLLLMMEEAGTMFRASVEAFVDSDVGAAQTVLDNDHVVDEYFNKVKEGMMKAIREQSLDADRVVDDLLIAKYLEKIGDHAVNIGRWTLFQTTGDIDGVRLY